LIEIASDKRNKIRKLVGFNRKSFLKLLKYLFTKSYLPVKKVQSENLSKIKAAQDLLKWVFFLISTKIENQLIQPSISCNQRSTKT
jgi:hypothetical protein